MKYAKALAVVLATVVMTLNSVLVDGVDSVEIVQIALAGLGAFSVAFIPNLGVGAQKYSKYIVAVGFALLNVLVTAIVGGLDASELINLLLAGLAALGVYAVPNKE